MSFRLRLILVLLPVLIVFGSFRAMGQSRPAGAPAQNDTTKQSPAAEEANGQANAAVVSDQPQGLIYIVPFGRNSGVIKPQFAPGGAHLTYFGGPIISNVQVVVVFWGPNVNTAVTANGTLDQFYTDITSSRFFDLLTEYTTAGVTGPPPSGTTSSNQTLGRGTFAGKFTITPAVCPGPAACTVTDAQIQSELAKQINNNVLPAPQTDVHGIINTYYAIYFPPGVTITDGTVSSCVSGGFCAYHSNTGSLVPYGVLPDFAPPSGCSLGCGGGTLFQNITAVSSHELSEAVTDAQVGSATVFGPPLAWYNGPTPNLGEIADICDGQDTLVNAGSTTYMIQRNFSNVQNDCVSAPPVLNLTAPAAGAGPALPFNLTLTLQNSNSPFTLTGYRGTVHFTSSDASAVLPVDYTFASGDAGSHTFSVVLNTLGDQTISVVDTHSSGFTGTTTVNVNVTPDLTIIKSHAGNFSVGQTGATYTLTVFNVGRGPTVGTVTVTDTLPNGLTATAISGTGWSCTLGTLTCTRADALAAGSNSPSYPPISLTVNVAANSPALVTNTATVSGGGETNTANNTANDPTTIVAPDMVISKGHTGAINGSFFQGETGATYSIFVSNTGGLTTSGTVTVVDTLPATGLTATAISGTGWSCTLANLTCTRSDALASGNGYPGITVTVDVALNAPVNVINTATVSGGGEVNTSNDVAQDLTIVLPPPAPDLSVNSFRPNNFVQGHSGSYIITVTNVGDALTSGTVTLTASLSAGLTATAINGTGWSCTLGSPSTCTRSDALAFVSSYPQIILSVDVAANAPSSVTNTITVTDTGDSNPANNTVNDVAPVAAPLVDLVPQIFGPFFLVQGQSNITETISVVNFGNIPSSGAVTLAATLSTGLNATSIGGSGWSCTLNNLTCTRSDALGVSTVYPDIVVTFNVANNAPGGAASYQATVSGGSDGSPGNNSTSLAAQITPMVQLLPGTETNTVNAGQPAIFSFQVAVANAAAGAVTFSCSGLPALSACSFSPPSVTTSSFVNMTVTTTASSTVIADDGTRWTPKPWLLAALLSVAMLFVLSTSGRSRRLRRLAPLLGAAGFLAVFALAGCGGGGGSQTVVTHSAGTPPGTYAVTITGTSANGTVTHVVSLTVR